MIVSGTPALALVSFVGAPMVPVGGRTLAAWRSYVMKASSLFVALTLGLSLVGAAPVLAQATAPAPVQPSGTDKHDHSDHKHDKDGKHDHKHDEKAEKKADKAKVGELAPNFKLSCTDGKEVTLESLKGKIVVIEWFNPDCPFIVKHHKTHTTFNDLAAKYKGKDVVMLAINSSAEGKQGSGKERNAKAKTDFKMEYPILMDTDGKIGRAYGARTTPHVYVIDAKGVLAYAGAIDDDDSVDTAGKTNYAANAVDALLKGESVAKAETKPYGCSVKY
jgi:peroxiredoxin